MADIKDDQQELEAHEVDITADDMAGLEDVRINQENIILLRVTI